MLKNFRPITHNMQDLQYAIPALKLLEKMLTRKSGEADSAVIDSIKDFNNFYKKMTKQLKKLTKMPRNSLKLETFK